MPQSEVASGTEIITKPEVAAVVYLGKNEGNIGPAAPLTKEQEADLVGRAANEKYREKPTRRMRCVDGRTVEGGHLPPEGEADIQTGGGPTVTESATELMLNDDPAALSKIVAAKTREQKAAGNTPVVHGDTHAGEGGCGAMRLLCSGEIFRINARQADVVAPAAWSVAQELGIDKYLQEDDPLQMIQRGAANAEKEEVFDITPPEGVAIAVENGAEYEELIEDHGEEAAWIDTSPYAYDEDAYMADNIGPDGKPKELFVATIGAYSEKVFEMVLAQGGTERTAALHVLGAILGNVGVTKGLANDNLPVIIAK